MLLTEGDLINPDSLPVVEQLADGQFPDSDVEELGLKDYVRVYTAQLERARIQRVLLAEG